MRNTRLRICLFAQQAEKDNGFKSCILGVVICTSSSENVRPSYWRVVFITSVLHVGMHFYKFLIRAPSGRQFVNSLEMIVAGEIHFLPKLTSLLPLLISLSFHGSLFTCA